ncbi:MAG TPA: hypothetical protein VF150_07840, partial [Thermoanaerobaculia bacterium]
IVPVGVRGTLAAQRRGSFRIAPARVEVRYGAPIDPIPYGIRGRAQLEADVRRRLEDLAGTESAPAAPAPAPAGAPLSPSEPPAHPGRG